MKKLFSYSTIASLLIAVASCSDKKEVAEPRLFPGIELTGDSDNEVALSSLFKKHRVIKLEDTEDCMIGGDQNKVIKKGAYFYIQSINDILVFDENGRHVKSLSKAGEGPEEYGRLLDFDVVQDYDEIWVSGNRDILRYSIDSLEFKGRINFPFFINRFKYIGNDRFIAKTPDDTVFRILDTNGATLSSYFKKDLAVSGLKPVDFLNINGRFISQLGNTNQAVAYDPATGEFEITDIITPSSRLEDMEDARNYFDKYGYMEFSGKMRENFSGVSSFRETDGQVVMILQSPSNCWSMILADKDGQTIHQYFPPAQSTVDNDIVPGAHPLIFNTLISGESDNSFIFVIPNEDDDTEENPSILEVFDINV